MIKKILRYTAAFTGLLFLSVSGYAMTINQLFNVGVGADGSAGLMTMNVQGGSNASVQYTGYSLYSDNNCTMLISAGKTIQGGGFPFNNGQTISLNSHSLFIIASGNTSVKCIKLFVRDGTHAANPGATCPQFTETCSGTGDTGTCVTSQGAEAVNYQVSGSPCIGF